MTRLSPQARAILGAARQGDEPTPQDFDRVRIRLAGRLGVGVVATLTSSVAAASASGAKGVGAGVVTGSLVTKSLLVVSTITVLGIGYRLGPSVVGSLSGQAPDVAPTVNVSHLLAAAGQAASERAEVADKGDTASSDSSEPVASLPSPARIGAVTSLSTGIRPSDSDRGPTLEQEVERLREAHSALRGGDAGRAMTVLQDPGAGAEAPLAEERAAMRVLALCRLGRSAEARLEAEQFLGKWPKSPQGPRVRAACVAESAAAGPRGSHN